MRGNWIEATSSTGGTGALTLADVTGSPNFDDVFGASGTRWVEYSIVEFTDSTRSQVAKAETGLGALTLSTLSLARSKVQATWSGTAYDDTSPAALSFGTTAANIRVMCSPTAQSGPNVIPFFNTTIGSVTNTIDDLGMPSAHGIASSVNLALTLDREFYLPYLWTGTREIVQGGVAVRTASAGGGIKAAIYEVGSNGYPGARLYSFASAFSTASAANVTQSVSGLWLPPGWYYIGLIADNSTVQLRTFAAGLMTPAGTAGNGVIVSYFFRSGSYSTGLPDPAASTSVTPQTAAATPAFYLKQAA